MSEYDWKQRFGKVQAQRDTYRLDRDKQLARAEAAEARLSAYDTAAERPVSRSGMGEAADLRFLINENRSLRDELDAVRQTLAPLTTIRRGRIAEDWDQISAKEALEIWRAARNLNDLSTGPHNPDAAAREGVGRGRRWSPRWWLDRHRERGREGYGDYDPYP